MVTKKSTQELVRERPAPQELYSLPRVPITVVVDNVRSLDNVGLLFRLCELARVERLYLTGYTGHPRRVGDTREEGLISRHEHRIFKTAVYAVPFQPWAYVEDPVPLVEGLKEQGSLIVAVEQTHHSQPYYQASYTLPLTVIVGHERAGIREELLALADLSVEIPILGIGNSHNVSHALAIVLYHVMEKAGRI